MKLDAGFVPRVEQVLAAAGLKPDFVQFEGNSVKARFADTDQQLKAKDALDRALNPDPADPSYVVALNLLSRSPQWLTALRALPMYLGLDLRGGVHFLLQVDMKAALTKKAEALTGDMRTLLRDKNIRHAGIARDGNDVAVRFRDARDAATPARGLLADQLPDLRLDRARRRRRAGAGRPRSSPSRRAEGAGDRRSSRTSPRCTTASTNSAWPSR